MNNLLEYSFEEIEIGLSHNFEIIITKKLIEDFAKISGDFNPLHMDEQYAKKSKFGRRICHGMLLSSFFSKLIGMYLPGKNALYFSQNLNFMEPCFMDDKIFVGGEVIDKSESTRMIKIKTTIKNEEEKLLIEGIAQVLVRWMFKQIGIGIDIADVEKFEKIKFEEKPGFYKKIFSNNEITYCLKYKNPYERFAGKFAIKEATIKAIKEKISLIDIETIHINSKPNIKIQKIKKQYEFQISVSHDKKIAVAVVISFENENN